MPAILCHLFINSSFLSLYPQSYHISVIKPRTASRKVLELNEKTEICLSVPIRQRPEWHLHSA